MPLPENQMRAIEVSERTMSVLSLVGSSFIITTFIWFPFFRKPINRLVFYASIGNIICNIATLISVSGISYGATSALCQFQGVLIQWFIPADSLWTFCMALNVYLTFFKNFTAHSLRELEKWYLLFCYGIPFIPALIYLLLDAAGKYGIYGPATLWCWVAVEWDWMRIAFFYGPVWVIISLTTAIYVTTGREIFKQRAALRSFSRNQPSTPLPVIENPFTSANLSNIAKVTKIEVTSESIGTDEIAKTASTENDSRSSFSSTRKLSSHVPTANPSPTSRVPAAGNWPYTTAKPTDKSHIHDQDPGTIFTTTVDAGSGIKLSEDDESRLRKMSSSTQATPRRRKVANDANTAAWGYAKVAMLMFVALFIVWVPSTINRVYSLVHPEQPLFGLNLASALVLPLQGFWNAMVYISTSWSQCKATVGVIFGERSRRSGSPTSNRRVRQPQLVQHHLSTIRRQDSEPKRVDSVGAPDSRDTNEVNHSFDLSDIDLETEPIEASNRSHNLQQSDVSVTDSTTALPLSRQS